QDIQPGVDDAERLHALETSPAADDHDEGDSGRDQEQEDDKSPSGLRLGLLPVRSPELVSRADRSRFHDEKVYGVRWIRATPRRLPRDARWTGRGDHHAGGGTRTPTLFRAPGPKPGLSSSSSTPAGRTILVSTLGLLRMQVRGPVEKCLR